MVHSLVADDLKTRIKEAMTIAVEEQLPKEGTAITLREASRKYGPAVGTISRWVKIGWVSVITERTGPGLPMDLDERDIARIVGTRDVRRGRPAKSRPNPFN